MKLFRRRMSLEYFNFLFKYLRLKIDGQHRIKLICRNINETMQIICQCIWKLFIGANHLLFKLQLQFINMINRSNLFQCEWRLCIALALLLYVHAKNLHYKSIQLILAKTICRDMNCGTSSYTRLCCVAVKMQWYPQSCNPPLDSDCAWDTIWYDMENWCLTKINEYRNMEVICIKD